MSASRPLQDAAAASDLTLGALLYADASKVRVSEGAWIALVAAVAAHDVRALHTLYGRLHGFVFTLALRITTSRSSAEEVTVDVFHDLWKRASRYSPVDGTVIGWVMNMTRSRAIDRVRYEKRKKRLARPQGLPDLPGIEPDAVEQQQQMALVKGALANLSEEERTAIELAYFSDATYAEVARQLVVPLGTIKSRIRSGLTKVRFALSREGIP
jgi:RNA polymerase sigma-70 factor (ECF subfamily)